MRVFLGLVLLLAVAAGVAAAWGWADFNRSLDAPVATSEPVDFTIERGWSVRRVANALVSAGLIDKPHWFEIEARATGKALNIQSGDYVIEPGTPVRELLDLFQDGRARQHAHTIIEGNNFREMLTRVSGIERLTGTLEHDASFDARGAALMAALGEPDVHPEGQFFADTYYFSDGASDIEFFARAKARLETVLAEEWEARSEGLPLQTPYEALVLASIVEKETALPSERPLIAGVFLSRLEKGMRLQTDPTVIYGIGESFDGDIRRRDLTTDTPYNTYTRGGLPPTPIAMVGREAINAVLHPEATTKLYFVSRGDGSHHFSETLEEHNAAVRKYQLGQ